MLLAFSEQTKGQKFPVNASDQKMLEIVMDRYEKELMHPIQNLVSGELARAMLIQVQKLKLDIETAMLELNQILRANEINFAVLAALPAFFVSLLLIMLIRGWFKRDTKAEGRGRIARIQRRLLVAKAEGMLVDRSYLAGIEKVTKVEQEIAEDRFRKWACRYCPDARHMNIGSEIQLRQLLFGGTVNRKNSSLSLPTERIFKIPNVDGVIEEGKKAPKKFRDMKVKSLT
ncbi:unnamed protein product [Lathyrus sativus]|nr:unnamed protein product [Lathyrus sativus]